VIVEPGQHRVEFRYRPPFVRWSAILSFVLLVLSGVTLAVERALNRTTPLQMQNGTA
jgi:hypothetical protein